MGKKKNKHQKPSKKSEFEKAKTVAEHRGHMVCATVAPDGSPIYYTMPRGASDEEAADAAFGARNGRMPTDEERQLLLMMKRQMRRG